MKSAALPPSPSVRWERGEGSVTFVVIGRVDTHGPDAELSSGAHQPNGDLTWWQQKTLGWLKYSKNLSTGGSWWFPTAHSASRCAERRVAEL